MALPTSPSTNSASQPCQTVLPLLDGGAGSGCAAGVWADDEPARTTAAALIHKRRRTIGSRTSDARLEAVADPVHGEHVPGVVRRRLYLFAQPRDVVVDGARRRQVDVAPHLAQQVAARDHLALVCDEHSEDV